MTDGSSDDSHRDLDPSLEPEFASLLSRHKEAVAKTEWSYQQFLPPEIEKHSLSPTAYMGRDGIADRGEPALVHGWPRSRPGELPGPDPGVRARLDVGGGSARDPARELPPADEKRGSGRPGALAEGHDRGGVEPRAGRTVPGDGRHGHARGGDPHVLPVRGSRLWRRGSAAGRGAAADRQGRDPSHGLLP